MALEFVKKNGGAIIYMQQEGRGIGLANKVAAYALQDTGLDTVDANLHLGFPEDCRQYGAVPSILEDMKIGTIQLLTNNPRKVERLEVLGVQVVNTIPLVVPRANPYNKRYLETKESRMRHSNFGDMLARELDVTLPSNGHMVPKRFNGYANGHVNGANGAVEKKNGHVIKKNGHKVTHGISTRFLTEGERMATHAVHIAFAPDPEEDNETKLGVVADADGYCFGRQSVEDAIAAIARGEMVIVVDDMDRENEGDFIMAADMCTPEAMAQIVRYSSGVVCVTMEGDRLDALKLPPMVTTNEDPKGTAFTVSVDGAKHHGTKKLSDFRV